MKSNKLNWHREMRVRAHRAAKGRCQNCGRETLICEGTIHHLSYPKGVYEVDIEPLMRAGICQWLCVQCHDVEHVAFEPQEARDSLKRGGYCSSCGALNFGGWQRALIVGHQGNLCRRCFKRTKAAASSGQLALLWKIGGASCA